MEDFRRANRNGAVVACLVLGGALMILLISQPAARMALYVALASGVLAVWFRWLGGDASLRAITAAPQ